MVTVLPCAKALDTKSSSGNVDPPKKRADSDQDRWRAIVELLGSQQYRQTIKEIGEAEKSFLERGDTPVATMLAAAKELCLTCQQVQAEKRRYDRASAEAGSRENTLRQQLEAIIRSLSGSPAAQASERLEASLIPATTETLSRQGLRQRLGTWLGRLSQPSGEVIPDTAETQAQEDDRQITEDQISLDTISKLIEAETQGESADEQPDKLFLDADEEDLATAKAEVDEPSGAVSPPGSDEVEKHEAAEMALAGTDRELLQGVRELLQTAMSQMVISAEAREEAKGKDTQPAHPEEEPLSQGQLPQPDSEKVVVETANKVPVIARDPLKPGVPFLMVYTLGPFRVIQDDQPVDDWYGSKGKLIFKYLISRREQSVAKEVLMELFWPGADPDAARNNLNVVIYGLRKSLRNSYVDFSHILYQEDRYLLNPEMQIWLDFEEFAKLFQEAREFEQSGQPERAMQLYQAAELLYQGEFLAEDRYEDWLIHQRQELQDKYMSLLERLSRYYYDAGAYSMCVTCWRQMLGVDSCYEDAHRQLMRFYYRQGQIHLALRQYHQCVEALKEELDITPTEETKLLAEKIRQNRVL